MADENQQLQQEMEQLRQSMQGLDSATSKAGTGLKDFAKSATAGIGNFAKTVGQGDTNFKSLNSVVDIASNALAGMAKAIPYAGEALGAGIKATAEAAKFMLDQMDQTTKAFNDLSKVGALTADGMSGVQRQFLASGLSLQSYTKQVSANSTALARMSGMVGDGAEEFSKITGELTKNDLSLRRLGMSADDIGETAAAFVTQQTRLGRSQGMSTAELIAGTKKYATELDSLQKITGMSREAIIKQQDAAMSESRFRAAIHSMTEQQQDDFKRLQTVMSSFGQELGQGTRDLVSNGVANTDASKKLMADTGGAAADIIRKLRDGSINATQAQVEMRDAIKANAEAQEGIQKYVDGPYSNFANKADLMAAKMDESGNLVKKTQTAQAKGADQLTEDTITAQQAMEKMNRGIQELGFTFLPAAATATAAVTTAMEKLVRYINDKMGGDKDKGAAQGPQSTGSTGTGMDMGGGEIMAAAGGGGGSGASKGSYLDKMIQAESGGKNIANQSGAGGKATSSAFGLAQITKGTFEGLVAKAGKDNPLYGKTFEDMKTDVSLQMQAAGQLTDANRKMLADAKVSTSDSALYLAHFLGPAGAIKALKAGDSSPLASAVSSAQLEANPMLQKMSTVADLKNWADKKMGNVGYSAKDGAILSGPTSGYKPNLTMHGTEAIVPLNNALSNGSGVGNGESSAFMSAQLERLDELVSVMKSQVSISQKIMQYSS